MENTNTKFNELEKPCDECGGTGRDWYDEGIGTPCWKCNGTGHIATETGRAILQLFAHQHSNLLQFA